MNAKPKVAPILFALLFMPLSVFAAVTVTFSAQSTSLFVDQAGTWTITVANPDATSANGLTLVATLPAGYSVTNLGGGTQSLGPPHTITWTGINLAAYGGSVTRTFSAKPGCQAPSGGQMNGKVGVVSQNSTAISILSLNVSSQAESSSLSIGEEGTWTFRAANPSASVDATGRTIVARVPSGFRVSNAGGGTVVSGNPTTITWSNESITKNSSKDFTFKAIPNNGCLSGQSMSFYAHCESSLVSTSTVVVKTASPAVKVTSGGSSQPVVYKGDTLEWDILVTNGGPGDALSGISLTETLGLGYTFVSLKDSGGSNVAYTGSWSAGASWNTGILNAGASKSYILTVLVSGCEGWSNTLSGTWTDGQNTSGTVSSSASAQFVKNLPLVGITHTFPAAFSYCGYADNSNAASIRIANSGPGPAENFTLNLGGLPADWGVKSITVLTGGAGSVTWNNATRTFSLGQLTKAGGARPVVEFSFVSGPTGAACPPTNSANLILFPSYSDECGVAGAPPVVGPISLSLSSSGLPSVSAALTGPRSTHSNDTGLVYTLTTGYAADLAYGDQDFNIVFTYPEGFAVTDAAGGNLDLVARTVAWGAQTLSPGGTFSKAVTLSAPNACGAGNDSAFSVSIVSQDPLTTCLGCQITLSASASQRTYVDDYLGPVGNSSKIVEYFNSMTGTRDGSLPGGEINTTLYYTVNYTFRSVPPSPGSWADSDGLGNNIYFYDEKMFGQALAAVDAVKVNGVSYPSDFSAVNFTTSPLDLGYLDLAGAPAPITGAQLSIEYRLSAGSTEGSGVDYSRLVVPGVPPDCGAKDYFETGIPISISRSAATVATNSPISMDVGEIRQFTMSIGGSSPWPLYDPILSLDTLGNYELVGGVGDPNYPIVFNNFHRIDGTAIAAFVPTTSGTSFTWSFADDLRRVANSDGSGPSPSLTFYMRKTCATTPKTWSAALVYNDRATDGNAVRAHSASSVGEPVLIRKAALDIQLQPGSIPAYDRYPTFRLTIWNKGSGAAYNSDILVDNGAGLVFDAYTVPLEASPDSVLGSSGDNDVGFHYTQIPPGAKRYLLIRNISRGDTGLGINVTTRWGNGIVHCEEIVKSAAVTLPPTQVIISSQTVDHKTDYAGNSSRFTVKAKNVGVVDAYNLIVSQTLPKGFSYLGSPAYTISSGSFIGAGAPTVSILGDPLAAGQTVTWDFSSILPIDAYGFPVMDPGIEVGISFDALVDGCSAAQAYTTGDKKAYASAAVDPPFNADAGGSINVSPTSILSTLPANPRVSIASHSRNVTDGGSFATGVAVADYGETVEYRITLTSDGDFQATNVRLSSILPGNITWLSGSTTVDGTASAWQPGISGSPLNLGQMSISSGDPSKVFEVIYRGTVNDAAADSLHQASVSWGVSGACPGTSPPMEQTSSLVNLTLRTIPSITSTLSIQNYPVVGASAFRTDGGRLRLVLVNSGVRAMVGPGEYLTIRPPTGYNFTTSPAYPPAISGKAGHPLSAPPSFIQNSTGTGDGNRGELRWDSSRIDYLDQGETITLDFYLESDGYYLDTTCASFGEGTEPATIPNSTVTANFLYRYNDTGGTTSSNKTSNNLTVNPAQADLDIDDFSPAVPVIQPGDTQKNFVLTLKNNGDAVASNVGKVAGAIDEPFIFSYGPGFSNPSFTNTLGGTVASAVGSFTIANLSTFNAGQSRSLSVTLDIVENRPITDYWVKARIRGTALQDASNPVAASSVGGYLVGCSNYSDDSRTIYVQEGRMVLRPDNVGTGRPGGEVVYLHNLRNNAGFADTFLLSATNSLGWTSLFYRVNSSGQITGGPITSIALGASGAANDSADFALRVFIPANAADGAVNVSALKATYQSDSQVFRTVTDTTTATTARLLLGKQTRNVTSGGVFSSSSQGKPGETIEYKISFINLSAWEVTDVQLSDPTPPFSDIVPDAYNSGGTDFTLKLVLYFADGTEEVFTEPSPLHPPAFIDLNTLAVAIPLSIRFPDGVFRLKAGERGELLYQVRIRD